MAELPQTIFDEVKRNDRYFLPILGAFILGLLLLFYKDLDAWIQEKVVPGYVVYLLGAALIAQVQNMLGNRERLRCEAQARPFTGTKRSYFVAIVAFHITWFAAFVAFVWRHLPT